LSRRYARVGGGCGEAAARQGARCHVDRAEGTYGARRHQCGEGRRCRMNAAIIAAAVVFTAGISNVTPANPPPPPTTPPAKAKAVDLNAAPDRSGPPALQPVKPFTIVQPTEWKLKNGVRVLYIERKRAPLVDVVATVDAGIAW